MPILQREPDAYPLNLLDPTATPPGEEWSVVYTIARREKELARRLVALQIPFYCPQYTARQRSPAGRVRESHLPLFPSYVFVNGGCGIRPTVLATNCVSRWLDVIDPAALLRDLQQVRRVLTAGAFVTPELRLEPGDRVRVLRGALAGLIGTFIRRGSETRLVVAVNFMQQGASVEMDEVDVERFE